MKKHLKIEMTPYQIKVINHIAGHALHGFQVDVSADMREALLGLTNGTAQIIQDFRGQGERMRVSLNVKLEPEKEQK